MVTDNHKQALISVIYPTDWLPLTPPHRAFGFRFYESDDAVLANDEISASAFIISSISVSAVSFVRNVGRRIYVTGDGTPARVFRIYHSTRDQIFQCGEARMNSEELRLIVMNCTQCLDRRALAANVTYRNAA